MSSWTSMASQLQISMARDNRHAQHHITIQPESQSIHFVYNWVTASAVYRVDCWFSLIGGADNTNCCFSNDLQSIRDTIGISKGRDFEFEMGGVSALRTFLWLYHWICSILDILPRFWLCENGGGASGDDAASCADEDEISWFESSVKISSTMYRFVII